MFLIGLSDELLIIMHFLTKYLHFPSLATCDDDEFACPGSRKCTYSTLMCDLVNDCKDFFDESPFICGHIPASKVLGFKYLHRNLKFKLSFGYCGMTIDPKLYVCCRPVFLFLSVGIHKLIFILNCPVKSIFLENQMWTQ